MGIPVIIVLFFKINVGKPVTRLGDGFEAHNPFRKKNTVGLQWLTNMRVKSTNITGHISKKYHIRLRASKFSHVL